MDNLEFILDSNYPSDSCYNCSQWDGNGNLVAMQRIAILLSKSAKSRVGEQQTELISYYIQLQILVIQ